MASLKTVAGSARAVWHTLQNPVDAIPPDAFCEDMVEARLLGSRILYLSAPELIRSALVGHHEMLQRGTGIRRALGGALGEGLLTAEDANWRWQRQALAPVFRAAGIGVFLPVIVQAAERCAATALGSAAEDGRPVAIERLMARLTGDVIVQTMLPGADTGDHRVDRETLADGVSVYLRQTGWSLIGDLLNMPEWLPHPGKRAGRRAVVQLRETARRVLAERRAHDDGRDDLLGRLIRARDPETGRQMDEGTIIDNLLTFLTAGHETTALALAWTFDLLGRHPQVMARVQAEIDRELGDALPTPSVLARLTYTRQAFDEAMRLYPPAPLIARDVGAAFTLGGRELTVGTRLIVPIYAVHRHRKLWEYPDMFEPARFSPEAVAVRAEGPARHAFMPFGAGPRVCIGAAFAEMEAMAVLAVLLRRFTFIPALAKAPHPRMEITLRPSRPMMMSVVRRTAS